MLAGLLPLYSKAAMAIYHIDTKTRGNESINSLEATLCNAMVLFSRTKIYPLNSETLSMLPHAIMTTLDIAHFARNYAFHQNKDHSCDARQTHKPSKDILGPLPLPLYANAALISTRLCAFFNRLERALILFV